MPFDFLKELRARTNAQKQAPDSAADWIKPDGSKRKRTEVAALRRQRGVSEQPRSDYAMVGGRMRSDKEAAALIHFFGLGRKQGVRKTHWWQSEHELVVQLPWFIRSWHEWSKNRHAEGRMIGVHRRATHEECCAAFVASGWKHDPDTGAIAGLNERLAAVGCVRIAPAQLDPDSNSHSFHYMRDGLYDVAHGFKWVERTKRVRVVKGLPPVKIQVKDRMWLGSLKDHERGSAAVKCHYNQLESGRDHGVQFIFFMKGGVMG